jgi:hypothetical protein
MRAGRPRVEEGRKSSWRLNLPRGRFEGIIFFVFSYGRLFWADTERIEGALPSPRTLRTLNKRSGASKAGGRRRRDSEGVRSRRRQSSIPHRERARPSSVSFVIYLIALFSRFRRHTLCVLVIPEPILLVVAVIVVLSLLP